MTTPRHTFVVAAYGESPYLPGCLASLQAQDTPGDVVVATSTPNDFIARAADAAGVPLVINPERNGGIGADWTFAYAAGRTDFVTIAHQDDEYRPEFRRRSLEAASGVRSPLLVFTDYAEVFGDTWRTRTPNLLVKRVLIRWPARDGWRFESRARKQWLVSFGSPISCPTVTYHRALLGPDFAFSRAFRFVVDWEAWIRLADRDGSFAYVPDVLMGHRIHPDSETTRVTTGRIRLDEETACFARLWPWPLARALTAPYRLSHLTNYFGAHGADAKR